MPFTQVQAMPNKPPTVRIFMRGQLMLQPTPESDACEVFVNRSAPNHHLTIEVREKRNDQPDEILMRHFGPLAFRDMDPPTEGLLIARNPPGSVSMYTGKWNKFGDSLTAAIDLRSEEFHASNELRIDVESTRPSIMIKDGIFHTAIKTSDKLKMKVTRGRQERDLPSFATLIGANIYLEQGEFLHLSWRDMGIKKTLSLMKSDDGATYEIYIINDPLFEDPDAAKVHDELAEYYKVLPTVPTDERLKIDVDFPQTAPADRGTSRTPCMPVIVNGP
jgi:hypothetical protein